MSGDVSIVTIEEGNPRSAEGIYKEGSAFVIEPYSEDDDSNYKFRLDVALVNESSETVDTRIIVDWKNDEPEHMMHRTYLLLCTGDEEWTCFDARPYRERVAAVIGVPPGESRLALHPPYDYKRLTHLVDRLQDRLNVRSIGKSKNNRELFAVEMGEPSAQPLAFTTRVHPYETIGSWLMEGMLEWLAQGAGDVQALLAERRILLLPMLNPDGVAEGTCKRTLGGLNFSVEFGDSTEPEAVAVREYLGSKNVRAIYDLHGWMHDYHGLKTNDVERANGMKQNWEKRPDLFDREIRVEHRDTFHGGKHTAAYFSDKYGAHFYIHSGPWYHRTAEQLRQMGVEVLKAYLSQY